MKMRLTPAVTARNAWLIAGRSAAGAAVLAISVSACTSPGSSVPSIFTPTPTGGSTVTGTHTPSPTGAASSTKKATAGASSTRVTAGASATGSATARHSTPASATAAASATATARGSASTTPTPTHTAVATHSVAAPATTATTLYPTAAPQTGGGGTAGLQDSLVFVVGGGAVLAGFGSLVYRRRLARKYGTRRQNRKPLDREPVDH